MVEKTVGSRLVGSPSDPLQARRLVWQTLRQMDRRDSYANIALERGLQDTSLSPPDRNLVTELVYGITRRQRTLDALIGHYAKKSQQPPDLRRILQIGFYQLIYLEHIPPSAAINTSVELTRVAKLGSLTKVVNGILRQFLRDHPEPQALTWLALLEDRDPVVCDGIRFSFPDWLITLWHQQMGRDSAQELCAWFNRSPHLDLRVNVLHATLDTVETAFAAEGISSQRIPGIPSALRVGSHPGSIPDLPGYAQGWWSVQDASAQQVVEWLDPQPHETIVDCCAAPGGKSTHMAEKMGDQGTIWGLDRHAGRLKRVTQNAERLGLSIIQTRAVDLAQPLDPSENDLPPWGSVDRVLLDAPCSGLGTLHRHADARWRLDPEQIPGLVALQAQLLAQVSRWVKPLGTLVYSTCTLHPDENQHQIEQFLSAYPDWSLDRDPVQIWPHHQDQDGFFLARLRRG